MKSGLSGKMVTAEAVGVVCFFFSFLKFLFYFLALF